MTAKALPSEVDESQERSTPHLIGAIVALLLVAGLIVTYCGACDVDDTYIYLRYIRNILSGQGWTYNVGEHVNGTTSIAWVVACLLPCKLFGATFAVMHGMCVVALAANLLVVFAIFRRLGLTYRWAAFFSALSNLEPFTIRWACAGMENTFVLLCISVTALLVLRRLPVRVFARSIEKWGLSEAVLSGLCIGLLPAARPELVILSLGGAIVIVFCSHKDVPKNRTLKTAFCVAWLGGILFIPTASEVYFGLPIPHTALAKRVMLNQGNLMVSLKQATIIVLGASPMAICLGVWLAMKRSLLSRFPKQSMVWVVPMLLLVQSAAVYFVLGFSKGLVSTRYSSLIGYPVNLAGLLVIMWLLDARRRTALTLIALQVVIHTALLYYMFPATRVSMAALDNGRRKLADYLHDHTPLDARIATTEIGVIGFFSERYIVDLVCLVDPHGLAVAKRVGHGKNFGQIEELLYAGKANYFIHHWGEDPPATGKYFRFVRVVEFDELAGNLSFGRKLATNKATIYRLEPLTQN